MTEVKVSDEVSDSLLYLLGLAFSESHGLSTLDTDLLKWNGGTSFALFERVMGIIRGLRWPRPSPWDLATDCEINDDLFPDLTLPEGVTIVCDPVPD